MSGPAPPDRPRPRAALRRRSIAWALLGGGLALVVGALLELLPSPLRESLGTTTACPWPVLLQSGLRAGGCGFFYGLLAFHLTRVDPDDSHLQAGLVGAVCGIHSLGRPLHLPAAPSLDQPLVTALPSVALELLQAWLPVTAAALLLLWLPRRLPDLRP